MLVMNWWHSRWYYHVVAILVASEESFARCLTSRYLSFFFTLWFKFCNLNYIFYKPPIRPNRQGKSAIICQSNRRFLIRKMANSSDTFINPPPAIRFLFFSHSAPTHTAHTSSCDITFPFLHLIPLVVTSSFLSFIY